MVPKSFKIKSALYFLYISFTLLPDNIQERVAFDYEMQPVPILILNGFQERELFKKCNGVSK